MNKKIGIVGSGMIGQSWAMIFASNAFDVYLYDQVEANVDKALQLIEEQLLELEKNKSIRSHLTVSQQLRHIYKASSLLDCVSNAVHVQECVFEDLDVKKQVFAEIDALCNDSVALCSSTSCLLPSTFAENLKHRSQVMVAHPINPPYFVPLVEIVPSKWTDPDLLQRTLKLLAGVGQKPVLLKREIEGFVVNRLQYSILNECYRLVEDGIISPEDLDTVMSEGLGMRYAFIGPWETAHLNAKGMEEYFAKYAQNIYNVSSTMGPVPKMQGSTAALITEQMNQRVPLEQLDKRRKWRDEQLMMLAKLKSSSKMRSSSREKL